MAESKPIHILYMEDDPGLARLFKRKLERAGYAVDVAHDGQEGLNMCVAGCYDVVAMDQAMPVYDGLEVIRLLAAQDALPPTIMVTGTGDERTAVEAMKLGARDYIVKDVDGGYLDLLPTVIERVLRQRRLAEEKRRADEELFRRAIELETLAHISSALRTAQTVEEMLPLVLRNAAQAFEAAMAAIFLVDSETGSLVARACHPPDVYPVGLHHPPNVGITGHVFTTGEVYLSEDITNDPLLCVLPGEAEHVEVVRGVMSLPLRTQERAIGVMDFVTIEPHLFSDDEVRLATAIADIAANAIHRAMVVQGLEEQVAARTAEIRAEQEKVETILRSVGDAIVMSDLEMRIQYVNDAFTALTGYSAEEVMQQHVDFMFGQTMPEHERQSLRLALNNGQAWQGEVTGRRKDGRAYDATLVIVPMRDADGRLMGYVSSHQDIGQFKELERARNRFITNVSHELRTPAANVKLYAHLLRKAHRPDKTERYLQVLEEQAERLENLIQDILEMTALDSGQAVTAWESISLLTLVENAATRYQSRAESSGLTLSVVPLPPDLPVVKGDPARLVQALGELVENAIIFTPTGGQVNIQVETAEEKEGQWVTVSVRDTGPGIGADEQDRVFDHFYRGSLAESGHIPGTGLGLSMVHEIMDAHGGRVTIDSTVGQGSVFALWLRADAAS